MLLKDFIEDLQRIYDESKGTHHHGDNVTVDFILEDPSGEIDVDIELVPDSPDYSVLGIEANTMMGCGCWVGATVRLRVIRAP